MTKNSAKKLWKSLATDNNFVKFEKINKEKFSEHMTWLVLKKKFYSKN